MLVAEADVHVLLSRDSAGRVVPDRLLTFLPLSARGTHRLAVGLCREELGRPLDVACFEKRYACWRVWLLTWSASKTEE